MTETHDLVLEGCTPEPLMSYLKALGVLRLVSEQKDSQARAFWRNGAFVVRSDLFDHCIGDEDRQAALAEFFLAEYSPTPIVAPWGARSGFYRCSRSRRTDPEKSARDALQAICDSEDPRLAPFSQTVQFVHGLLRQLGVEEKAKDEEKLSLLNECRARFPDALLPWLDATYVLTNDDRLFPPLLGTGGNEGSASYVSGFAQQIVACVLDRGFDSALANSLFSEPGRGLYSDQTPGHFSPTSSGGANAGQGFERDCLTNPWDYILMTEGTLLFAGVATKRLGTSQQAKAAFPFTVEASPVGYSSSADEETEATRKSRGEMWLPLWSKPVSLREVKALIGEGRSQVGSRMSNTGVDFARAIVSLGTDRGITSFIRYAFLKRNGEAFMATPLGRFDAREPKKDTDLLREIDAWLDRFRKTASDKNVPPPPRFRSALRRIESAIFDFCQYAGASRFAEILCALGNAERELANAKKFHEKLRPLSGLSFDWVRAANDNSTEFELAVALANVYDSEIGPIRTNLEAVALNKWVHWAENDRHVVWSHADLTSNLCAVLERRLMDGARKGCSNLPIASARRAGLEAATRFLWREVDDRRIEELLWGLVLVRPPDESLRIERGKQCESLPLPRSYALLKHLFMPDPYTIAEGSEPITVKPEPAILPLLRVNRIQEACEIAMRRLRASGLVPMPHSRPGTPIRDAEWVQSEFGSVDGVRLAAALLIPISSASVKTLSDMILRTSLEEE